MATGIAKHNGTCKVCGNAIVAGTSMLKWAPSIRGSARHIECYGKPDAFGSGEGYGNNGSGEGEPQPIPMGEPAIKVTPKSNGASGLMAMIADEIAPFLEEKLSAKVDESAVERIIRAELDKHVRKLTIEIAETGETKDVGLAHELFEVVLNLVSLRSHTYLYGGAGGGKTHVAEQVAASLGWDFDAISLTQTSVKSEIVGYMSPSGTYVETPFYRIFKNGGIFVFDEVDNSNGNVLTVLNSALANNYYTFPNGERVKRHENCVILALGNTIGEGANAQYSSRQKLDGAFRERFKFVEWHYDHKLEREIALSKFAKAETVNAWVDWVQAVRTYAAQNFPRLLVTPRASIEGAAMLNVKTFDAKFIANAVLFKGTDADTVKKITAAVPYPKLTR